MAKKAVNWLRNDLKPPKYEDRGVLCIEFKVFT